MVCTIQILPNTSLKGGSDLVTRIIVHSYSLLLAYTSDVRWRRKFNGIQVGSKASGLLGGFDSHSRSFPYAWHIRCSCYWVILTRFAEEGKYAITQKQFITRRKRCLIPPRDMLLTGTGEFRACFAGILKLGDHHSLPTRIAFSIRRNGAEL